MDKLSICILTYNEERHLPRLLDQLARLGLDAEILVFDSFSNDSTETIAKSHENVRFAQNRFVNFAAQRNSAIEAATGDWILMLDADEMLSEKLANEIASHSYVRAWIDIFDIPRKNYFFGQWMSWTWPDYQRRLFRKKDSFKYSSDVHESIFTDEIVGKLEGHIEHLTVGYNMSEWLRKVDAYTEKWAGEGRKMWFFGFITKPLLSAMYYYIVRGWFRDGIGGVMYACMTAMYWMVENAKRHERYLAQQNKDAD